MSKATELQKEILSKIVYYPPSPTGDNLDDFKGGYTCTWNGIHYFSEKSEMSILAEIEEDLENLNRKESKNANTNIRRI
jgi:hypothetical protein